MELNQLKALCRACLTEEGTFQSIFLVDGNSGFSVKISEMLSSFSMIQVIQGDGLPEQICTECVKKIIKMYLFKLKFRESDIILRARLKKVSLSNKENSTNRVKAETELLGSSEIITKSDYNSGKEILIKDFARFKSGNCKSEGDKEMFKNGEEIKILNDNLFLNKKGKINEFQCNTFQEMIEEDDLLTSLKIAETIKVEDLQIKDEHCFQVDCDSNENANLMPKIENNQQIQESCDGVNANLSSDQLADMKLDLKNEPYGCDMCLQGDVSFNCLNTPSSSPNLMFDKKKCTNEKTYEFDVSKKKLTKFQNSTLHKISRTTKKTFKCNMCDKKVIHLLIHKRTHTAEKKFECEMCEKKFRQKHTLMVHKRTHTGEKPFKCDICKLNFAHKQTLINHKRTHTGEKLFECDMCEKKFTQKQGLIEHKRTHTGENLFECDMCVKKFTRKQTLIEHKRTHTGEKPFKCDICETNYAHKQTLINHKRIHTSDKPFECDV